MKTLKSIMALVVLTLMMSACAPGNATPISVTPLAAVVSTDVASTLTAQAALATSTPISTSTQMSTPAPSPTLTLQASPTSTVISNNIIPNTGGTGNTGSTGSICDNSTFVADVTIPDGTVLAPDTAFTKTWTLRNIGNCTWSKSYVLAPVSGNSLGGTATQLPKQVAPGGSVDISVSMTTPDVAGTYFGYWRLQNGAGTGFGEIVFVKVVVSNSVADEKELTPTPAETTLPTQTAKPGNTPAPTSTSKP